MVQQSLSPPLFAINSLTSNAGDTVSLPRAAVTAIVGSNNAGKSRLLRDIELVLRDSQAQPVTLAQIGATTPVAEPAAELEEWLDANAVRSTGQNGVPQWSPTTGDSKLTMRDFKVYLDQTPYSYRRFPFLGTASSFFLHLTSAGALATHAAGSAPVGPTRRGGMNPLGHLYRDGDLEAELDTLSRSTFGEGLMLDRANAEFRLRVGDVGVPVPLLNHPTREYADAVLALPTLDEQGDGMRSFVGLALLVMARPPGVLLIDEPEAFLHPGQARALGRWLGGAARGRELQVIIATHDRDFLLGLLEADAPVNVVRITRHGDKNRLAQLPPEEIQQVWADPVLRYSNVLQGLFHRQVVVCESDGDCRFFGAALDEVALASDRRAIADDVLFVPGGGKQRVAAIANALGRLRVRSRAIVDFDVFRNRDQLRAIVESVAGSWSTDMANDYVTMVRPIQQGSIWERVKNQGLVAVPPGEPNAAAQRLLAALAAVGVYVVPVGEMEGFDRSQSLHGAAWVSTAIEGGIHKSEHVARFVEPLLES
ncbi:ATP-dependent nuclease [Microbacterium stercoris]|uniref:AAA family ATPase n=1 Tax=Microbacterium stercoris TaxID=2820289 RepID=A0A939QJ62_9MICO|nr:AAA family ATPase [Microbacterium stercoris]MBO3663858.1 AAA family ATPase [Microbacterium stercoris]